jgi:hypothetical protein
MKIEEIKIFNSTKATGVFTNLPALQKWVSVFISICNK